MGSKRAMLKNGLGELLHKESQTSDRVVDLFCGAGSVSWFSAIQLKKPVLASDLQHYAVALANAVIGRTTPVNQLDVEQSWLQKASNFQESFPQWKASLELDERKWNIATWRKKAQHLCEVDQSNPEAPLIWRTYGGHYYSPKQALILDSLLHTLPKKPKERAVCLAALITAASRCAAAPGHTAQPFKATQNAGVFLREAWQRDPFKVVQSALKELCLKHASFKGEAVVGDANDLAGNLKESDLVFLDPPYSGVHYSRFYHVLETIARNRCGEVSGVGRYPSREERPISNYSMKRESQKALNLLLKQLSLRGCKTILTFPNAECSNGLSGQIVEEVAESYFTIEKRSVKTRFSTLGGNIKIRASRNVADELILVLKP